MITAKKMAFREEIRRKQIDEKFKKRRNQLLQQQKYFKLYQQAQEFIQQFKSITFNLSQISNQNHYYIYQGLLDMKQLIMKRKKYIATIIQQQYNVIESISNILHNVNQSFGDISGKQSIFNLIIQIFSIIITNYEIKSERIYKSGFIQATVPYLKLNIENKNSLQNILNFFGNIVKGSLHIGILYSNLLIPNSMIRLMEINNIHITDRVIGSFLFFLRNYFEEVRNFQFSPHQLNLCIGACIGTIDRREQLNLQKDEDQELLQDALKVFKQLINVQYSKCDISQLNLETLIVLVENKNNPINIKKQALHIIDCIVFSQEDTDILEQLIRRRNFFARVWGVQESLKYVVINIMANVALQPEYKKDIRSYLPSIKLQLRYSPDSKFVYRFLLHYFSSQSFSVQGTAQQSIIKELWNCNSYNRDIMQIQAKIWLNLCQNQQVQRPPLRILEAKDIPQVQLIFQYLEQGDRQDHRIEAQ